MEKSLAWVVGHPRPPCLEARPPDSLMDGMEGKERNLQRLPGISLNSWVDGGPIYWDRVDERETGSGIKSRV